MIERDKEVFKKRKENQAKLNEQLKEQREQSVQKIMQEFRDEDVRRLNDLKEYKDVQKVTFAYFKHLSTLSTGSILILIAFLEKVFSCPRVEFLALISIGCFAWCLVLSLGALQSANNLVIVTRGMGTIYATRNPNETEKVIKLRAEGVHDGTEKIIEAFGLLRRRDKSTKTIFLFGIGFLLIFVLINFFF